MSGPAHENPALDGLLGAYRAFVDKVDAHAARTHAAHVDSFACEAGCSGCCHRELTVFGVEAGAIAAFLRLRPTDLGPVLVPPPRAEALRVLDLGAAPSPCVMLDGSGRCRIYPARPIICRTHGLPVAIEDDDGVYGDVCPLNFAHGDGLAAVDSADFLALGTLNTVLAALNRAWEDAADADEGRVALRELAARLSSPGGSPGSA